VGPFYFLLFFTIFVMLIASQLFWIRRVLDLGERFIPGKPRRAWLAVIAGLIYLFFLVYNYGSLESVTHVFRTADPRLRSVLIEAAFWWWLVGSLLGFALVIVFWTVDRATRAAARVYRYAKLQQVTPRLPILVLFPSTHRRMPAATSLSRPPCSLVPPHSSLPATGFSTVGRM